jgi:hypothetical protein
MIDRVILVSTTDKTALEAKLVGDLTSILNICAEVSGKRKLPGMVAPSSQLSAVATGRDHHYRTLVFLGRRLNQKHIKTTDFI